jgi:ubiquinone/menaquinone biosynthesis C-methylase UbiE
MRGIEQIPFLYDAMMTVAEATGFGSWRQALVAEARGRVLDVGCGTGRNLPLFDDSLEVVGVDVRVELLVAARTRAPNRLLVLASAEALPFRASSFDMVVSGLVFCSVPDPAAGLKEIKRVLVPTGALRMLEHVRSTVPTMAWWQDFIQPAWTFVSGGCYPTRDTEATVREKKTRSALLRAEPL